MFEDPVCVYKDPGVYKDPEWEVCEISTQESPGLVRVVTPGGVAVYAKKRFLPLLTHTHNHKQMGSPEIHRALHDVKTEENTFELPVCTDKEIKWDITTQKPHADVHEVKHEQMGNTELQSVLRALENELNMAEASIEAEHEVKTRIDTITVPSVLEKSQKKQARETVDKFQQDLSKKPPYEVLGEYQHIGAKRYCCHVCKRQFGNKCRLVIHVQVHSKKRKNHCIICNTGFSSQLNLKKHLCRLHSYAELKDKMRQTRVVNYMCKFCKQRFFHESLSTKVGKNLQKPYVCFACHKLFIKNWPRLPKYVCGKCSERFEDAVDLVIHHKRSHAGAPKSYSRLRS